MKYFLSLGVAVMALNGAFANQEIFSFENGILKITTDRYEVLWKNGSMISAKSFLSPENAVIAKQVKFQPRNFPNGPSIRSRSTGSAIPEYHPWFGHDMAKCNFQINQTPDSQTPVTYETTEEGARLVYKDFGDNKDLSWTQEFQVDPETGDLCILQKATAPSGGLSGISFGIYNLDASIPLAVPSFPGNGQVWRSDHGKDRFVNIGYPRFWSAGIIIGMIPGGGSFAVWSDDKNFMPKYFRHYTDGERRIIGFEAALTDPYEQNKEIEVFGWRFNTFAGNWTEPAFRYRDHLQKIHSIKPLKERTPKWADGLAMIWSTGGGSAEELEKMADKIDPNKIVLWDFTGSTIDIGLNEKVPDYIPSDKFIQRNTEARAAGFHIASYYSMALVDAHAHPTMMKDYDLGFYYDALGGKVRTDTKGGRLIYIHPGSEKWRKFYADKMKHVFENYQVDVLYQDVAGTAIGSSGIKGGKNFNQAVVAADAAIHEMTPEALIAGEYWNEVTIVNESIGLQRSLGWGGKESAKSMSDMKRPHPICSLLFSPFSYYFAYKVPQLDPRLWHLDQNINEVIGSLPDWRTPVDDTSSEAKITLARAKLWADGFKPWFPSEWEDGVASYMKQDSGALIRYRRDDRGSFCTLQKAGAKEKLLYGRITGVNQLEYPEPVHIPNWIAYNDRGPIGLNSDYYYCVFAGTPEEKSVVVTGLPEGAYLTTIRETEDYILLGFNQPIDGQFSWRVADTKKWTITQYNIEESGYLLGVNNMPSPVKVGEILSIDDFHYVMTSNGVSLGKKERPKVISREYNGERINTVQMMPPSGGANSEFAMEKLITLPKDENLQLSFYSGRRGGAGDGVNFIVRVNGKEIWKKFSPSEAVSEEQVVPLGDYAGKTVVLSICLDAGPAGYNRSNDESLWGNFLLKSGKVQSQTPIQNKEQNTSESKTIEDETYR